MAKLTASQRRIIKAKLAELEAQKLLQNEIGFSHTSKDFCVPGDLPSLDKMIENLKKHLKE